MIINKMKRELLSEQILVIGNYVNIEKPIFQYPINSKYLDMWRVNLSSPLVSITVNDIHRKMLFLHIVDLQKSFVVPLLHD